jgi:hypothetical protein
MKYIEGDSVSHVWGWEWTDDDLGTSRHYAPTQAHGRGDASAMDKSAVECQTMKSAY